MSFVERKPLLTDAFQNVWFVNNHTTSLLSLITSFLLVRADC